MPTLHEAEAETQQVTLLEDIPPEHLQRILRGIEDAKAGRTLPIEKANIRWADEDE